MAFKIAQLKSVRLGTLHYVNMDYFFSFKSVGSFMGIFKREQSL